MAIDLDDILLDDSDLLQDRLLRSLHKNEHGHLAGGAKEHRDSVSLEHNVAILHIYRIDADKAYYLEEEYLYSSEPLNYQGWRDVVFEEVDRLTDDPPEGFHGVYGWTTALISITPLRQGDLLIKVDKEGARCVRLAFNSKPDNRTAHEG